MTLPARFDPVPSSTGLKIRDALNTGTELTLDSSGLPMHAAGAGLHLPQFAAVVHRIVSYPDGFDIAVYVVVSGTCVHKTEGVARACRAYLAAARWARQTADEIPTTALLGPWSEPVVPTYSFDIPFETLRSELLPTLRSAIAAERR